MPQQAGDRLSKRARELRVGRRKAIGWRYVPAIAVYCAVCSLFILWLAWTAGSSAAWFACGFSVGVSLLFIWISIDSTEASRQEGAGYAEMDTHDEVRKRASQGWQVWSNIPFKDCDVDHVAIGPGGVVVLETKRTDQELANQYGRPTKRATDHIVQVARNSQKITGVLRDNGYEGGVTTDAVVVWGRAVSKSGELRTTKPAGLLIDGDRLRSFLTDLPAVLTEAERAAAANALQTFVDKRRAYIAGQRPAATSQA